MYLDGEAGQIGSGVIEVFQIFRRMNDLTQKNDGIRGKASDVERQLRDRVLEVCCQEQVAKLSRQEERAMDEERAKKQRVQLEKGEERVEGESREEMREKVVGGCGR